MSRQDRLSKILEIIRSQDIETQKDLAEALHEAGYDVTQATVSRDIRHLQLQKKRIPGGRLRYEEAPSGEPSVLLDKYIRVMKEGVVSMDRAQNILVIKTVSGMAMGVAAALDAMHFQEVIGCIAGDDTIMAVTHSNDESNILMHKLQDLLGL